MLNLTRKSKRAALLGVIAAALLFTFGAPIAGQASPARATAPSLGTATSFAVLGATTVTNTGATTVNGNLGVSPGTAVTGFPPGTVNGTTYAGNAVAAQAQADALVAYNNLAGQACNTSLTGQDLGGLTLIPGVYCFTTSAQLTGNVTLNCEGNPDAVFIFKIGSTLTTASGSSVTLIGSCDPCSVYFQVGSSATLGTGTMFVGSILASTSITLATGATVNGRVLALNGAVTLDTNTVTIPSCAQATSTAIPAATNTAIAAATNTAIPAATNTAIAAATNTAIAIPTNTAIAAATKTAIVAPTKTAIAAATPRATAKATHTAGSAPKKSPTSPPVPVVLPRTGFGGTNPLPLHGGHSTVTRVLSSLPRTGGGNPDRPVLPVIVGLTAIFAGVLVRRRVLSNR